jgi:hypothetical protein
VQFRVAKHVLSARFSANKTTGIFIARASGADLRSARGAQARAVQVQQDNAAVRAPVVTLPRSLLLDDHFTEFAATVSASSPL